MFRQRGAIIYLFVKHVGFRCVVSPKCCVYLTDSRVRVQVVGLYRLCGSAAVKKELREAFERDSGAVELCENTYPDVNVITGKHKAR